MFIPDEYLNQINITYYPDRMWGITVPIYLLFLVFMSIIAYNCVSILNVRPTNSFDLIMDESTRYIDLSFLYKFEDLEQIKSICKSTLKIYKLVNGNPGEKITEGGRSDHEKKYELYDDPKSAVIRNTFKSEDVTLDLVHLNNEIDSLHSNKKIIPVADLPLPLVCEMIYSNKFAGKQ
ncbi:phosphatidylinositol N-acetylglucosaminyltransferase subunit PIG-P [Cryptosporidium sp. chipmunk genotype I]|uniref:phosphatidylinositol N-acetylglucosaminyltransferase subunit PIG-P n=1 Tax=Cryptosporidium sp. chipmunk genotype I TaxID=1280935 RepID=UPI00351A0AD1|nr:phosphatidylinositol N-acetylglucosaminyltransferase subunit PIG-P [Cryptosporidium sp. chipmunk genotype I]